MTGPELRKARKLLRLTQRQMAVMLGYKDDVQSRIVISKMERDVQPMSDLQSRMVRAYLFGYRPLDWPKRFERNRPAFRVS